MKTSQKIKQSVVNNLAKTTLYENVTELLRMQQIYEAGIKEVRTKLEILDAEFKVKHDHNPIHHIESRLKSPESILKKAINKDIPVTERSLEENIHDIAGIRVICNYVDDVYKVAQLLTDQDDIRLVEVKDYIANPKESGYMSYQKDLNQFMLKYSFVQLRWIFGLLWNINLNIKQIIMFLKILKKNYKNVQKQFLNLI